MIRPSSRLLLLLTVFALVVGGPIWGLEVTAEFDMGNLGFAKDRLSSATDYPQIFPWGLALYVTEDISSNLTIDSGFYFDQTLKNISYTRLHYSQAFFTLGVGPFFGFFNSRSSILQPGISTAVRIDFPGIAFVEFRADSSIGGRMVQSGDYLQERSDLTAGLYVLNAIATVNLLTKTYAYRSDTEEIVDDFVEYSFRTDLFQKNVPIKVLLSFAYQKRGKSFTNLSDREVSTHELNSLILGTKIDSQINDYMSVVTSLESSIYSFGSVVTLQDSALLTIPSTGIDAFLFNAGVAIRLNLDRILDGRGDL
jgi:hypothetical protein